MRSNAFMNTSKHVRQPDALGRVEMSCETSDASNASGKPNASKRVSIRFWEKRFPNPRGSLLPHLHAPLTLISLRASCTACDSNFHTYVKIVR
jgi:hypothetical protein